MRKRLIGLFAALILVLVGLIADPASEAGAQTAR
ncbi:MAG: hypothetical protein QOI61_1006, partial [Actinomycetota bacterium]